MKKNTTSENILVVIGLASIISLIWAMSGETLPVFLTIIFFFLFVFGCIILENHK